MVLHRDSFLKTFFKDLTILTTSILKLEFTFAILYYCTIQDVLWLKK